MKLKEEKNIKVALVEGWEIEIAETVDQIEEIRPVWERMQNAEESPSIDADIDRYLSVMRAMNENVQPYVITLAKEGIPVAMIIARIQIHEIKIKLGYKSLLSPKLKSLTVVYGGILGEKNDHVSSLVVRVLIRQLREKKFDLVFLNHLKKDSNIFKLARKIPGIASRGYFPKYEKHWAISIPETMKLFYKSCSPNSRKQYKRCIRKLENDFPKKIRIVTYSQEDDLDEAVKYASQISAKTYQYQLGHGFTDDFRTRCLLKTAVEKGWLHVHILFVDDEACAFEIWFRYGKTYHGQMVGFDPKWKKWRVGTVLFLKTLELICDDSDMKKFDFGFGDAEYKQSYGNQQWKEASVYIFAPKFYPVLINFLYSSFTGIYLGLDYLLNKTGIKKTIKRLWRHRLIQKDDV